MDPLNSINDTFRIYPGNYALVAGGSKGIGYAIAEALAKRNYNLILVARNLDGLVAAKNNLDPFSFVCYLCVQPHLSIIKLVKEQKEKKPGSNHQIQLNNIQLKIDPVDNSYSRRNIF